MKESIMKIFNPKVIADRRKSLRLTYRGLAERIKQIDKRGNGLTAMACQRIEEGLVDPKTRSVCLICEALDLSPRSTYTE
jgi:predicted transcriptional regulator